MKEFVEKLLNELNYQKEYNQIVYDAKPRTEHEKDLNAVLQSTYDSAIRIVKRLAGEYERENLIGWIPCSDRLPEVDGSTSDVVLVCTVDGFQHMAFWCDDEKWRYCESGMIKNTMEWTEILAWQPLLAPYQPKGE